MPIDPNIILSARPTVPLQDPLERYSKLQAIQNGVQQQQINAQALQGGALDLQAKQRDFTGQQALSDAIQKNMTLGPDGTPAINHAGVTQALGAGGNGRLIPGYMTGVLAQQKAQAEAQKVKLENARASLDTVASVYAGANDQAGWDHANAVAVGLGIDPAKEGIPPVFSPEAKTAVIQRGMTIKDNLTLQYDKLDKDTKAAAEKRNQEKWNTEKPGVEADVETKQTNNAAEMLATAAEQDAKANGYVPSMGPIGKGYDPRMGPATSSADGRGAAQGAHAEEVTSGLVEPGAETSTPTPNAPTGTNVARVTSGLSPKMQAKFANAVTPDDFRRIALTPEQATTAAQQKLNAENTEKDRKITQQQGQQRIDIANREASLNARKFSMEFGGDAVKGWSKQVQDNPDTANQVPPHLRTQVMQQFSTDTGLPFPKPLTGTAVDQERASRNALDAVAQVKDALADPEIQSRLGPILGRLGSAEQRAGTAIGLSPAAEEKAQRLRTNMRYLVFQEGKALLGGRLPEKLMQALESSSPSVSMDAPTMQGAMAGVSDAANRNLDQSFKQRFGEKAVRPGSAAAPATVKMQAPDGTVSTVPADQVEHYLKLGAKKVQ
jgi:hypothetical protein